MRLLQAEMPVFILDTMMAQGVGCLVGSNRVDHLSQGKMPYGGLPDVLCTRISMHRIGITHPKIQQFWLRGKVLFLPSVLRPLSFLLNMPRILHIIHYFETGVSLAVCRGAISGCGLRWPNVVGSFSIIRLFNPG